MDEMIDCIYVLCITSLRGRGQKGGIYIDDKNSVVSITHVVSTITWDSHAPKEGEGIAFWGNICIG